MAIPTIKPDGTLTDYGKMLKNQEEAQKLASTYKRPEGFKEELGMYGGLTPTYEAYAASNVGLGNAVLGRNEWEQSLRTSNQREFMDREGRTVQGGQQPTQQISQPQTITPTSTTPSTTSNVYDAQSQLLINQLKQKIAEARAQQEGIIKNAPQQFDPLRAQSELSKGQQLRQVLERNANLGDRGGIGRSATLQTQTAGENRLNAINLQQQNVIDTANQRIADLESQGRFEEANILAQQRIAELQDAMAQQRLAEQRAYNERLSAEDRAYEQQLLADELARKTQTATEAQAREDFNNTILANYNDLMGFANQLRNQGAPQWQIDAVLAARQQKIAEQGLDQMGRPLPVDTTPQLTSSSAALELWKQLGVANEAISRALDVPVGQRYTDTSRSSGGSSVGTTPTNMTPKQVTTFVTETLRGTSGTQSADMLVRMNDAGYFDNSTPAEIKSIMNKFGVNELMLEQAENRMTIPTQGVTLPTGRTTFPSGSGLSGMTSTIR